MSRYRIALGLAAAAALALCSPASAQYSAGQAVNLWSTTTGAPIGDTAGRPLYVTGGSGGGDASAANQVTGNNSLATIATNTGLNATAANQTAVQAVPGSDATKAQAVQGVTGGKPVNVSPDGVVDGASTTVTFAGTGAQNGATINTAGYSQLIIVPQAGLTATGDTLAPQVSMDGTNWVSTTGSRIDVTTQTVATTFATPSATQAISVPVTGPFMRLTHTAQTAGSITYGVSLKREPAAIPNTVNVQSTATSPVVAVLAPSTSSAVGNAPVVTSAVASSLVVKASGGNLYSWRVTSGASAGYVLIINATSAPGDGGVTPLDCIVIAANSTVGDVYTVPQRYGTGITIVFSTTGCFSKTASATAFITATAS